MSQQIQFYPFNAINEFMRPDFRLSIIREVLVAAIALPSEQAQDLAGVTKRIVKIPGFRNSDKAPAMVKVMPMVNSFEKHPEIVGVILSAWATIHKELASQVYTLLNNRNWFCLKTGESEAYHSLSADILEKWPLLPPEIDRKRAPGFFPHWPEGEDFETLYSSFIELFPESDASMDQVSLMVVWLTLRLPYSIDASSA